MSDEKATGGRRSVGRGRSRPLPVPPGVSTTAAPGAAAEAEAAKGRARGRGRALEVKTPGKAAPSEKPAERERELPGSESERALEEGVKELTLAKRPPYGTSGRPIKLETNHFSMILKNEELPVFKYDVKLEHSIRGRMNSTDCRVVFWKLVTADENREIFPNRYTLAYDGASTLYSLQMLRFPHSSSAMKLTTNAKTSRDNFPANIDASLTLVGGINMRHVQVPGSDDQRRSQLQFLDIVTRQNRSLFNTGLEREAWYACGPVTYLIPGGGAEQQALGAGRYMWHGMFAASHFPGPKRPLLNIDVSHGTFYYDRPDRPVLTFLQDVLTEAQGGKVWNVDQSSRLSFPEMTTFRKAITGMRVKIIHRDDDREYVVHGVPRPWAASEVTFPNQDGVDETVASYFARRYGALEYRHLPVVQIGSKKRPQSIPIEKCKLVYPQRCTKKLTDLQQSKMIRNSAKPAPERKAQILRMVDEAGFDVDPWLASCGITISTTMTKVEGRVLPAPKVEYTAKRTVFPRDGQWNLTGQRVFRAAAPLKSYGVIFQSGTNINAVGDFLRRLDQESSRMGVQIAARPTADPVQFDSGQELEQKMTTLKEKNGLDFLFVVTAGRSTTLYSEIKRVAEMITGVMTQCIQIKTVYQAVGPRGVQTLQNIVLKINTKMGGVNHRLVPEPVWGRVTQPKACTIFMGANITHPGFLEKRMPSIAAVVSSVDHEGTRYSASLQAIKRSPGRFNLEELIKSRLVNFHKQTKMKPARIIFYRDGLAEGEMQQAARELQNIRDACSALQVGYRPTITFIVTTKRHHTRFFCLDKRDASGRSDNIPPGTLVEKEITSSHTFDFYLCSHAGIQGTSRPARYTVVCDENNFTADEIQTVTHNLTHLYCRCNRSVSIPAPLYYAYWVNLRAKHYLAHKTQDFDSDTLSESSGSGAVTEIPEEDLQVNVRSELAESMYFV